MSKLRPFCSGLDVLRHFKQKDNGSHDNKNRNENDKIPIYVRTTNLQVYFTLYFVVFYKIVENNHTIHILYIM